MHPLRLCTFVLLGLAAIFLLRKRGKTILKCVGGPDEGKTFMLSQEQKERLENLKLTLILLRSYRRHGIKARAFMITEHLLLLESVQNAAGKFESYPIEMRIVIEQRLYVEFLERLCQLIEDFAIICNSLLNADLEKFPGEITKTINPESFFKRLDETAIRTLLRHRAINAEELTEDELSLVESIRTGNINALKDFRGACEAFLDLHWLFYQKHKHGNTLIYGIEPVEINHVRTISVPAIANSNDPSDARILLVDNRILKQWNRLFNVLIRLLTDIVDRACEFIERGEVGLLELTNLHVVPDESIERMRNVLKAKDTLPHYYESNTQINGELSEKTQARYDNKYQTIENFLNVHIPLWNTPMDDGP